jgi:hypothetical protein
MIDARQARAHKVAVPPCWLVAGRRSERNDALEVDVDVRGLPVRLHVVNSAKHSPNSKHHLVQHTHTHAHTHKYTLHFAQVVYLYVSYDSHKSPVYSSPVQ